MKTPKISVIVPVYNAEKYLRRCIDSILAQTFTDFELLLIDDGSNDRSGEICDEYAAKDSRIRVFHKENGGVSSARNLGLDNAKGIWVTFVDSDDWVDENAFQIVKKSNKEDLIIGSFLYEDTDENVTLLPDKVFPATEIRDFLRDYLQTVFLMTPWSKLYKKDIIERSFVRFDENINWGEDALFVYNYLTLVSSIRVTSYPFYHYVKGTLGLSSKTITAKDTIYAISHFFRIIKKMEVFKFNGARELHFIVFYYLKKNLIGINKHELSFKRRVDEMKTLFDNNILHDIFNDRKSVIQGIHYKFFCYLAASKMYFFASLFSYIYGIKIRR